MTQETERTTWHRWAENQLSELGIQYSSEVDFAPYRVDIYIPDCHAAVELDGPHHLRRHDERRDQFLWETYRLPIIRFDTRRGLRKDTFIDTLTAFLVHQGESASERKT